MFCDLVGSTPLSARLRPRGSARGDRRLSPLRRRHGRPLRRLCRQVHGRRRADLFRLSARRTRTMPSGRCGPGSPSSTRSAGSTHAGAELSVRLGIASGLVVVGDLIGAGAAQERGGRRRDAEPRRPAAGAGRSRARSSSPRARGGRSAACSSSRISGRSRSPVLPSRSAPGAWSAKAAS